MSIAIGFYEELVELQKDDEESSFGFLSNIDITDENTARNYLHGCCDEFAAMLSHVYGYPIEAVRNAEGRLIHAYCVTEIGGEKAYIDVRGITTDVVLFFEEFENEVTYYAPTGEFLVIDEEGYEVNAEVERWDCKDELFEGDYEGWEDIAVIDFIKGYADYYDINKYISIEDKIRAAAGSQTEALNTKDKCVVER